MNYIELRNLNKKLYFKIEDVSDLLDIKKSSAKVLCTRYVKRGLILRLKKNFYILKEKWENLEIDGLFKIANFLQVPSYISFMSALSFYEITTQIQRDFIESASQRRTNRFNENGIIFNYYKLKENIYFGFQNINGIFIAIKEKALLDCIYLYSLGRYKFDISSIDFNKFNKKTLRSFLAKYPEKTKAILKKLCKI